MKQGDSDHGAGEPGDPSTTAAATDQRRTQQRRTLARVAARMNAQRARRAAELSSSRPPASIPHRDSSGITRQRRQLERPFRTGFFAALGVALAYVAYLAVAATRHTLLLIAVAAIIAIGLDPGVRVLMRRGLRRGVSVAIVFITLLVALTGALYAIVPPIATEVLAFARSLPSLLQALERNSLIRDLDRQFHFIDQLQSSDLAQELGSSAADGLLNAGLAAAGIAFDLVVVLVLTLVFLAAYPRLKRAAYRTAPASRRERVQDLGDRILDQMGGYLLGMSIVALQAGIVAGAFAAIAGLPYPWAIGLAAMLLDFVPIIGPITIGVSMTLLGFTVSAATGLIAGLFYLAQHLFEVYWLYPRVMRRQVDISTGSVIVAILVGAALLGVTGALLAVPVAAAVQLILREVVMPIQDRS
ncbi:AI-2E family transporter [Cumulibacter manganitolerans]|uniref:AI-2E family transporter n=1 Tax=Cumulibacter manganitolerans TaxID=1884992 RepID=UPI001297B2E3|nr:AI-2E family transporter [Cumulibacter manganitolerans]